MAPKTALERYIIYVDKGHTAAGFTDADLARNGGFDRLRAKLHDFAAFDLMESDVNLLTLEMARIAVSQFILEINRRDENNNYDYTTW